MQTKAKQDQPFGGKPDELCNIVGAATIIRLSGFWKCYITRIVAAI